MDGIESLWSEIQDKDDVAQKRYLMFKIFDKLLTERFSIEDKKPDTNDKVGKLKDLDGYMYKLSQDFLTLSSTMKKENKLEKIIEHVERKID
jgi:hypothetical protein